MSQRLPIAVLLAVCASACVDPTPEHPFEYEDAGREPADPVVVAALRDRYVGVASAHADEICRCSGDLAICRRDQRGDWDEGGRECLARAIALDVAGWGPAFDCLDAAEAAFESCHAPLACMDIDARDACTETFRVDGGACLGMATTESQVALGVCQPRTMDGGT